MNKKNRDSPKSNKLVSIFQIHIGENMNLAGLKFLAHILCSLSKVQTVSFAKLATAFDSNVETQSSLRRIQRFMANYNLSMNIIAKFIISILPIESPYILSMDRTNWKFGKLDINYIGCCYNLSRCRISYIIHYAPKVWQLQHSGVNGYNQ